MPAGIYKRTIGHGLIHGMNRSRFRMIHTNMLARCRNPKSPVWKNYGGRGITVCERWLSFLGFKEDMYPSYLKHGKKYGERNTFIDRRDNEYGYSKANCRWVTRKTSNNNRRKQLHRFPSRLPISNKTKFMGVSPSGKKWTAHIMHERKLHYLGTFIKKLDAAKAYNKKAEELRVTPKFLNKLIKGE